MVYDLMLQHTLLLVLWNGGIVARRILDTNDMGFAFVVITSWSLDEWNCLQSFLICVMWLASMGYCVLRQCRYARYIDIET